MPDGVQEGEQFSVEADGATFDVDRPNILRSTQIGYSSRSISDRTPHIST